MTNDEIATLAEAATKAPRCSCPGCGREFEVLMRPCLDPYAMKMVIYPNAGKVVSAATIGGIISAMDDGLQAAGRSVGHATTVTCLGVDVSDDMTTTIRFSAIPVAEPGPGEDATSEPAA